MHQWGGDTCKNSGRERCPQFRGEGSTVYITTVTAYASLSRVAVLVLEPFSFSLSSAFSLYTQNESSQCHTVWFTIQVCVCVCIYYSLPTLAELLLPW